MTTKRRSPIDAIKTPDHRIRRDARAAIRYVLEDLEGERLREFLAKLHSLLVEWEPTSAGSGNQGSAQPPGARA